MDTTALLKAILYQCSNRGPVTAKNECAGGVLGRGEVGADLSLHQYGTRKGRRRLLCGGIAGLSRGVLRSCAARPDVTRDGSLPGIAGEGRDIADCIAMQRRRQQQTSGARWPRADGTVSGNYYLQEKAVKVASIMPGQTAPSPLAPSPPSRNSSGLSHLPRHLPGRGAGGGHSGGALRRQPGPRRLPGGSPATAGAMAPLQGPPLTTTTSPEPDGGGVYEELGDHYLLRRRTPPASRRGEHSLPMHGWSWHSGRSRWSGTARL